VAFGHDPERPVLQGIELVCEPGTVTALVGPSGAGKSTLAALAGRFWDVTSGAVLVGRVDVREAADLYRTVGFVLQDSAVPRTSLRDAIRLARPSALDAEVEAAARTARVHDRIMEMPRGYDTVAGEEVRLSGGERQRIAIARLLLADPAVLVLDEATAHLDPESEAEILAALSALTAGRTVLVVAHRLATVTGADQICVLDRGRIVQRGTHADLIREPGTYRDLWEAHEGVAA
jgi:ATP-binding cassette subfamily B protein